MSGTKKIEKYGISMQNAAQESAMVDMQAMQIAQFQAQVKTQCLSYAVGMDHGNDGDAVIATAKKFYEFVAGVPKLETAEADPEAVGKDVSGS